MPFPGTKRLNFSVVGTSFRFSPLEIREKLSFSKKRLREAYHSLKDFHEGTSFLILSTCNRSEVYGWGDEDVPLQKIFCRLHGLPEDLFEPFIYQYQEKDAFRHFVRVLCGLDSQILGEGQIFLQGQRAYETATEFGAIAPGNANLIARMIALAGKIRKEAGRGFFSGTLADAAWELVRRNSPSFNDPRILLIGTGKVIELFISLLCREGIRPVIISNRNHGKAAEWAAVTSGKAAYLEDLSALLTEADVIISATSCPHPVLRREHFRHRSRPVLVLDLAVPRDAEPSIKEVPGVRLFDLDDLGIVSGGGAGNEWLESAEHDIRKECEVLWKELSGSEQEKVLSR